MAIVRWYWDMTKGQRTLCWIFAVLAFFVFGFGVIPAVILGYGHLGRERYLREKGIK